MNKHIYKDDNILIVRTDTNINNYHTFKVTVKDKYRGIIYYDIISKAWGFAYGNTLRGRYFFFTNFEESIDMIIDTIQSIYHLGNYRLGAKIR